MSARRGRGSAAHGKQRTRAHDAERRGATGGKGKTGAANATAAKRGAKRTAGGAGATGAKARGARGRRGAARLEAGARGDAQPLERARGAANRRGAQPAPEPSRRSLGARSPSRRGAVTSPLPTSVVPAARSVLAPEPRPGQWLFATREGSEQDLIDELRLAGAVDPAATALAPALVLAPPLRGVESQALCYARQGFPIGGEARGGAAALGDALGEQLAQALGGAPDYALQAFVPDSRAANPLAGDAAELYAAVGERLAAALPTAQRLDDAALRRSGTAHFAQLCLLAPELALWGVLPSQAAPSLAPGGRTRVRVVGDLPSRAARKVVEALAWLGLQPGPEELCVDLGAAPGGWCYVLLQHGARVVAVDPARLRPDIAANRRVRHIQQSAFSFTPDEPADWLFCDLAWRPLEVAALLAKWGRRRWTRQLVANIKLPMAKKVELLARVRHVLEQEGGYRELKMKQLYHDRDEITLTARVA